MGVYSEKGTLKVTVNDTTGVGRYAADGSIRVTLVSGSTYTGINAADGSMNVVNEEGSLYHPCGAVRGRTALGTYTGVYSPSGAFYMEGLTSSNSLIWGSSNNLIWNTGNNLIWGTA